MVEELNGFKEQNESMPANKRFYKHQYSYTHGNASAFLNKMSRINEGAIMAIPVSELTSEQTEENSKVIKQS